MKSPLSIRLQKQWHGQLASIDSSTTYVRWAIQMRCSSGFRKQQEPASSRLWKHTRASKPKHCSRYKTFSQTTDWQPSPIWIMQSLCVAVTFLKNSTVQRSNSVFQEIHTPERFPFITISTESNGASISHSWLYAEKLLTVKCQTSVSTIGKV